MRVSVDTLLGRITARSMILPARPARPIRVAHLLSLHKQMRVIGLTSAANADFVKSLGCYDEVVNYDRISSLSTDQPVAFVDMAGNGELRAKLHRHFGDRLTYSGRIGLTHQNRSGDDPDLPGAKPAWFFAPDQIRKRAKEWGPGGIDQRFGSAWSGFAPKLDGWIKVIEGRGPEMVRQIYLDTLGGRVAPDQGHLLSLLEPGGVILDHSVIQYDREAP